MNRTLKAKSSPGKLWIDPPSPEKGLGLIPKHYPLHYSSTSPKSNLHKSWFGSPSPRRCKGRPKVSSPVTVKIAPPSRIAQRRFMRKQETTSLQSSNRLGPAEEDVEADMEISPVKTCITGLAESETKPLKKMKKTVLNVDTYNKIYGPRNPISSSLSSSKKGKKRKTMDIVSSDSEELITNPVKRVLRTETESDEEAEKEDTPEQSVESEGDTALVENGHQKPEKVKTEIKQSSKLKRKGIFAAVHRPKLTKSPPNMITIADLREDQHKAQLRLEEIRSKLWEDEKKDDDEKNTANAASKTPLSTQSNLFDLPNNVEVDKGTKGATGLLGLLKKDSAPKPGPNFGNLQTSDSLKIPASSDSQKNLNFSVTSPQVTSAASSAITALSTPSLVQTPLSSATKMPLLSALGSMTKPKEASNPLADSSSQSNPAVSLRFPLVTSVSSELPKSTALPPNSTQLITSSSKAIPTTLSSSPFNFGSSSSTNTSSTLVPSAFTMSKNQPLEETKLNQPTSIQQASSASTKPIFNFGSKEQSVQQPSNQTSNLFSSQSAQPSSNPFQYGKPSDDSNSRRATATSSSTSTTVFNFGSTLSQSTLAPGSFSTPSTSSSANATVLQGFNVTTSSSSITKPQGFSFGKPAAGLTSGTSQGSSFGPPKPDNQSKSQGFSFTSANLSQPELNKNIFSSTPGSLDQTKSMGFKFGSTESNDASGKIQAFQFGSTSQQQVSSTGTLTFGSKGTVTTSSSSAAVKPSLFAAVQATSQQTTSKPAFLFNGSSSTSSSNIFGATNSGNTPSANTFTFGMSSGQTSQTSSSSGLTFKAATPAVPSSTSIFSNTSTSSVPPKSTFNFGQTNPQQTVANASSQSITPTFQFGQSNSQSSSGFSFGASSQTQIQPLAFGSQSVSNTPSFGIQNSSQMPGFGSQTALTPSFGNQASNLPTFGNQNSVAVPNFGNQNQNAAPMFGTSQPAASQPAFQFGATNQQQNSSGFNLGASASTPNFGASAPTGGMQFGQTTTPQKNSTPSMFSIGSAPRKSSSARMRHKGRTGRR